MSSMQFGLVLIFAIVISIIFLQPAFAETNLQFTKILDIDKESLQTVMADLNNFPKIFPDFIKSVESSKNGAKMVIEINGFHVYPQIEYYDQTENSHVLKVVSGDLKGTKLTTKLVETWGFNGEKNQGTIVNVDMNLQFSGFSSFLGVVSDDVLKYSVDRFLLDTVSYAKFYDQENLQLESAESENKPKIKKGHRRN